MKRCKSWSSGQFAPSKTLTSMSCLLQMAHIQRYPVKGCFPQPEKGLLQSQPFPSLIHPFRTPAPTMVRGPTAPALWSGDGQDLCPAVEAWREPPVMGCHQLSHFSEDEGSSLSPVRSSPWRFCNLGKAFGLLAVPTP